ncbi:hypothetical protein D9619_008771 [Psilocybe cf. subviscida]|uniref:Uncharacterized protein n=1 Tax=Psilocybe cf. subviscida TaxID=2480587 RepID=A0A8H5BBP3_9AGAR|nr:hypothetical protein D9619_008771 [Psilocybe cf. subviscida]
MTATTPEVLPELELAIREAQLPEFRGWPVEDALTGDTLSASALKRKRIDDEENLDSKPALKKFQKEGEVLKAFGKALVSNMANSRPSSIGDQVSTSLSTSRKQTSRAASEETSQSVSSQLPSNSNRQVGPQGVEPAPRLPSTGDDAWSLVWGLQQAVHSNAGPHCQNPTAGLVFPNSQPALQYIPRIPPSYANHAMPPLYLDNNQQIHQQMQQHSTGASVNLLPVAPGLLLPFHPQAQLSVPPPPHSKPIWPPSSLPPPTTPEDIRSDANTPSTPGHDGRSKSNTIERFADILVDLIELQATKAVSTEWVSCQSQAKVDQGVQTDIPGLQTTEAGTQTEANLHILDAKAIQVISILEIESGH